MKNINYVLMLLVLLASCEVKEKSHTLNFDEEITLTGQEVLSDKSKVQFVYAIDSLLLTRNFSDPEKPLFSLFSLNTFNHICDFGKIGSGPDELNQYVNYCGQYEKKDGEIIIWLNERFIGEIKCVNLSSTIKNSEIEIENSLSIKMNACFSNNVFWINDSCLVGNVTNMDLAMSRIRFYNPIKEEVIENVSFPYKVANCNNDITFLQYTYNAMQVNVLRTSPGSSKLVSSMCSFNRLDIFDKKGVAISPIIEGLEEPIKDIANHIVKKGNYYRFSGVLYYKDLFVSDKYIYALFIGHDKREWSKQQPLDCEIRIFSWEGDALAKIHVSESLRQITVDEKNGYVYAIRQDEEKVMRYNIKKLLDEL